MRRLGGFIGGLCALALIAVARPAAAHPHVFAEVSFGLQFADKGLEAIDVTWRFDEMYSQAMLPDYLKKGEKQLSAAGVQGLYNDVFRFLGDYRYYTDVTVGGNLMKKVNAGGFTARSERGALVFHFMIPLDQPVASGTVDLLGFDPDYFIEYTLAGAAKAHGKPFRHQCKTQRFQRETDITGPIGVAGLSCVIG
ncbi:DUF1007 family protein [Azospirillum griseum]|uniref:DUF1007 family protein n=1 Tax=Azospirillum griseum TaxID=2496639 RepID=A0A431VLI3_9PROT|nr:DUF1007 family protein [Azospirillum griseum]